MTQTDLITTDPRDERLSVPTLSPLALVQRMLDSGKITTESVQVTKELLQMDREVRAEGAKAAFAAALFQLRKTMPEIYIDKAATNDAGKVTYRYASEEEITSKLDPHLMAHGFTTLFGQSQSEDKITVTVTLMHEAGHSEDRSFTVRPGATNRMKDASAADSGAATTALRHLLMKMFGLRSHMTNAPHDAKLEGEFIADDKQIYLEQEMKVVGFPRDKLFQLAGCSKFSEITEAKYDVLLNAIEMKRGSK
jgi:hypothetical protein